MDSIRTVAQITWCVLGSFTAGSGLCAVTIAVANINILVLPLAEGARLFLLLDGLAAICVGFRTASIHFHLLLTGTTLRYVKMIPED